MRTYGRREGVGEALVAAPPGSGVCGTQPQPTDASSHPRPADAAGVFPVWPGSGVAPGSERWTWHEQTLHVPEFSGPNGIVRNVVVPTVAMFKAAPEAANGTSLIVAPGGAFKFLMMDSEGYDLARWLTRLGVTAFVLKYRTAHMPESDADMLEYMPSLFRSLPRQDPTEEAPPVGDEAMEAARGWAEEDGRQAVRFVRQRASEWSLDPRRIGIAGFSAGGGIAVAAATEHDAQSRPDFAAGLYPVYRRGTAVRAVAPPLFIATAQDDVLLAPLSATRLYEAWRRSGCSAELHVFAAGRHGFGMKKQDLPSDAWTDLFRNWLATQGLLS